MTNSVQPKKRMHAVALLAVLICVPATVVVFVGATRHPESLAVGDRIASLIGSDLDGRPRRLDTYTPDGAPHVWLIVSASCVICRAELAEMQKANTPFSRVTVVSLSSAEETRAFMRQFPALQRQTAIDSQGVLQRAYGRFRTPTGLLMNSRGVLLLKWHGLRPELMRSAG
jgi:hypothetical protein